MSPCSVQKMDLSSMSISSIPAIRMHSDYSLVAPPRQTATTEPAGQDTPPAEKEAGRATSTKMSTTGQISELHPEQLKELERLQERDQEVRAHEMAHMAAGGQYVKGGANFQYQRGPDGQRYAVGGEVRIDISEVPGDPEATAEKMRAVKRAAMAPAMPSSQDRMVATKASRIETEMQLELLQLKLSQAESEYRKTSELFPANLSRSEHPPEAASQSGGVLDVIG